MLNAKKLKLILFMDQLTDVILWLACVVFPDPF